MRQQLTVGRLSRFYLPLAMNSILMIVETPVVTAGISRLPDAERHLAAYGVMVAVVYTLVNIVVPLTHTGNALGLSRESFRLLRDFSLIVCAAVTLISAGIYFTPVYDVVVEGMLGTPRDVADLTRPAAQIMLVAALAIGWRRFYHGVLIRHGYTGVVGWCTLIRVVTVCGTVVVAVKLGTLPGVQMAAVALALGAVVESAGVTLIAESILRRRGAIRWETGEAFKINYGATLRFFVPLALVLVLTGTMRPIITAGMARLPDPILSLAAFPVAFGVFNIVYQPLWVLPQTVIALVRDAHSYRVVIKFVRCACLVGWAVLFGATFTPVIDFYLATVLTVPPDVRVIAIPAVRVFSLYIIVAGWQTEYQGLLIARRLTGATQMATGLNVAALALTLTVGLLVGGLPGVLLGAMAYVLGFVVETVVLRWQAKPVLQEVRGIGLPPPVPSEGPAQRD
ncbi:MAG: hypothetical protein M0Z94_06065 [Dehalococcoidales bacterium]|nr:hypothetical protein [Dehalococcoidales bacterium]